MPTIIEFHVSNCLEYEAKGLASQILFNAISFCRNSMYVGGQQFNLFAAPSSSGLGTDFGTFHALPPYHWVC